MNSVIVISLVIVFLLFIALVASRSQALQRFAVMELLLLCVIAGGAAWGYGKASAFSETQYLRLFGVYLQQASSYMGYLEELELDEDAQEVEKQNLEEMLSSILPVATVGDTSYAYLNAAILERDVDTYQAVLHVGEDEAFPEEWLEEAAVLAGNAISQQSASYGAYTGMDGERIGLLALADPQKIAPDKVLLVEISLAPMEQEMRSLAGDYVYAGSAIGLIGTLLLATVIVLQGAELRRMVKVMNRVGEGKEEWDQEASSLQKRRYRIYSNEMRSLWNSLGQIVQGVARINYMKYRTLQAYYRFAPKRIEELLNKHSILDVEAKDSTHASGVLAVVSLPGEGKTQEKEYIARMNDRYLALCGAQKEYGGIFLAGSRDLTMLELMFTEQTQKALYFGIEAAVSCMEEAAEEEGIFILLHKTRFVYGVAGDEEQASAFVLSDEMKLLEKYTDRMRSAGIRMAGTDAVYEVVEKDAACRYIGFIEEGDYSFKLYEVLDAYPARERRRRIEANGKFQEGLSLFYRDDFYLARSAFTEVLKECPTDEVAKWYLFTCERCLDSEGPDRISYGFLSDMVVR